MSRAPFSLGIAAAVFLSLAACSKPAETADEAAEKAPADEADARETPPAAESAGVSTVLTLGEAKIAREGHEDRAIEIAPDGKVTLAGTPFGTLSTDGRLTDPQGALMMTLQSDGSVVGSDGPIGMKIDVTGGSLSLPKLKVKVRFADDGAIVTEASGPNAGLLGQDTPQLRSKGCDGAVRQACALVTLSYLMALGNPDSVQEADAP